MNNYYCLNRLSVFPVLCVVSAFAIPVFMCGLAASVGLIALMHVAVFLEVRKMCRQCSPR